MEYSFRNSPMDASVTVVLGNFAAVIRRGTNEEYIPYANITSIRLCRFGKLHYRVYLYQDSLDPIVISNKNFDPVGRPLEQSEKYHQFVYELHRHLTEKSRAAYTSGNHPLIMMLWVAVFLGVSFGLSLLANIFRLSVINFYADGAVLFVLMSSVTLALNYGNLPKTYSPTDIPVQFLP